MKQKTADEFIEFLSDELTSLIKANNDWKTDVDCIGGLHKKLVDYMYSRAITSDLMEIFHQIIHKWEQKDD